MHASLRACGEHPPAQRALAEIAGRNTTRIPHGEANACARRDRRVVVKNTGDGGAGARRLAHGFCSKGPREGKTALPAHEALAARSRGTHRGRLPLTLRSDPSLRLGAFQGQAMIRTCQQFRARHEGQAPGAPPLSASSAPPQAAPAATRREPKPTGSPWPRACSRPGGTPWLRKQCSTREKRGDRIGKCGRGWRQTRRHGQQKPEWSRAALAPRKHTAHMRDQRMR